MANVSWPDMPPLPVPLRSQHGGSDCLAACVAMALEFPRLPTPYAQLLEILDIGPLGAPRRNVTRLAQLGVRVEYREATFPILVEYLEHGLPVIAFVDTAELPYLSLATNHAVVVIGLWNDALILNDPAFGDGAQTASVGDFELAWLNADNMCATITQ